MKAEVPGGVTISMSSEEAHALVRAIGSQAMNARKEEERPIVDLYRAICVKLMGYRFDQDWKPS